MNKGKGKTAWKLLIKVITGKSDIESDWRNNPRNRRKIKTVKLEINSCLAPFFLFFFLISEKAPDGR